MNGFFMATTRLLFSMGRGKFLHPWFLKVHPKYGTPTNAVLFTLGLTLIAPFFGRSALNWIVDMSAMGTALAYLSTCLVVYKYASSLRGSDPVVEQVRGRGRCADLHRLLPYAGCARLSGRHWVRIVDYAARMGSHRCLLLL